MKTSRSTAFQGDCLEVMKTLPDASVDAVVTDPPYGLVDPHSGMSGLKSRTGIMGKKWDAKVPGVATWQAALQVLKPGGCMLCFGGTRTYHRLACAVEDAGFQIRDCLMWIYGSGFPKGKGCLKPAWEPILLARKPGPKALPLGIDACRIPLADDEEPYEYPNGPGGSCKRGNGIRPASGNPAGRWPANVVHDGSEEVLEAFAVFGERRSAYPGNQDAADRYAGTVINGSVNHVYRRGLGAMAGRSQSDYGTAARFFYCAKASASERGKDNTHPTVKPLALMRWLINLICPPGGSVLDPFMGSGTTGVAALQTGCKFIGIEIDPDYCLTARWRLAKAGA